MFPINFSTITTPIQKGIKQVQVKVRSTVHTYNYKIENITNSNRYPETARITRLFLQSFPWILLGMIIDCAIAFPITTISIKLAEACAITKVVDTNLWEPKTMITFWSLQGYDNAKSTIRYGARVFTHPIPILMACLCALVAYQTFRFSWLAYCGDKELHSTGSLTRPVSLFSKCFK